MKKALEGIRILDLTRLLPGSFGTQLLADYGAEVIKLEEPVVGDANRHYPPFYKTQSAFFLALNRNKKSLTLNLKSNEGKEIFKELVKKVDILTESFRPGVMDRLGLGYAVLRRINRRLIFCSLSGFGQSGPYRSKAGHDLNYISLAGLMSLMCPRNGAPVIPALPIADVAGGGLMMALGVLIAICARHRHGIGQRVDLSMLGGMLSLMTLQMATYLCEGKKFKKGETFLDGAYAFYNVYRTMDGRYIGLAALEEKFWGNFCKAIEREDLISQQFAKPSVQEKLRSEVQSIFLKRTCQEWVDYFAGQDVCLEPVWELHEVVNHPQVKAQKMVVTIDHPTEGRIKQLGFPIDFSETPGYVYIPSPGLGEHNEEYLAEVGYNSEDIERLREQGVI